MSTNHFYSTLASGSDQSSLDRYDLSSDDNEYLTPNNVAEITPRRSNHTARLFTVAMHYFNSSPESSKHWGQVNPNRNDNHSDPIEISSTFWLPDITDWWHQHKKTHSKYTDVSNVARDVFSVILHAVGVEASSSLGRNIIRWRQSKTTCKTFCKKVVVGQYTRANDRILADDDSALDTAAAENDIELKREAEE